MTDPFEPRRPGLSFLPVFLLMVLAFAGGVWLDRTGRLPGGGRVPKGLEPTFAQAWRLVRRDYVDQDAVKPERMTEGAIAGMLASLGDRGHTTYLPRADYQRMEESLQGHMEGIGARISMRKQRPVIVQTMPGSPARQAGLKPGDTLVQVDGKDVIDMSLQQLVEKVRGPAGTQVHLEVLRGDEATPLSITITRGRVEIAEVSWALLPGTPEVADIAIQEFASSADTQLRKALQEAKARGVRGLILDLRGNPGGLKEQAVAVTSEFLQKGQTIFIQKDAQGREEIQARDGGMASEMPLVVLIDEGTASSAEIFAGALQDHERATLVGTRTFGTGTVLRPYKLSDGSAVLLAVAEWLTPKGRQIWHKGITPDVEVALPRDANVLLPEAAGNLSAAQLAKSDDKQMVKAIEVLRKKIR